MKISFIIILFFLNLQACSGGNKKKSSTRSGGISSSPLDEFQKPKVVNISYYSNKIRIDGNNLDTIKSIWLRDSNGGKELFLTKNLPLADKNSAESIFVEAAELAILGLNKALSLVITDAMGNSSSYTLTFELEDGSIKASMLSDMGANDGNTLIYNSSKKVWEPRSMSGLNFQGTWDPSTNEAPADYLPGSGEYWVVSTDGIYDLSGTTEWKVGDWAIFNGSEWQQIKNSDDVVSFNGRQGAITSQVNDYTWVQIDKSNSSLADIVNSSISDIGDVDATSPATGEVLKWNGSAWVPSLDENAGGASSVNSTVIVDGTIVDADISASASIAQSKIANLTSDLAGKQDSITTGTTAQYFKGDLSLGTLNTDAVAEGTNLYYTDTRAQSATVSDAINDTVVNLAPSQNAVFDALALKQNSITTGTTAQYFKGDLSLGTLNTDAVAEGANLYYTDARAKSATVADSITDGVVNTAPSQNAVFDALALKGNGDFKSDGSVAMTGDLDVSIHKLKFKDGDTNYVSLESPLNLASDLTFVLPSADGSAGQILKTDGAGNLSWVNDSNSGVVSGSIVNADINASAAIAQSKIANLISDLAGKQNNITTGTTAQYFKGDLSLGTLNTDAVAEGTNLYFTDARAKSATITDAINDTVVNLAPSQNAVFDALALKQTAIDLKADSSALTSHSTNATNPHSVTKAQVGLANVDNTSDASKPISTATQTALDGKADNTNVVFQSVSGDVTLKTNTDNVGLGITPTSKLHVKSSGSTNSTYALKVENSVGNTLLSTSDDGHLNVLSGALFGNKTSLATTDTVKLSLGATYGTNPPGSPGNLKLIMWDNGNPANLYGIGMSGGLMEFRSGLSGAMAFYLNNGVEAMKILNTGNIGLNQTTPTARLHIKGSGTTNATYAMKIENSASQPILDVIDDATINLTGKMVINGTSGPGSPVSFTNPNALANYAVMSIYPNSGTDINSTMSVVPRGNGVNGNKAQMNIFSTDYVADQVNYAFLGLRATGTSYDIFSSGQGTAPGAPLRLSAGIGGGGATNQLYLNTDGTIGIGTATPKVALDIAGQMRMSKNSSEPFTCDTNKDGAIAVTSNYKTCICRQNVGWVFSDNGKTCNWQTIDIIANGTNGRNWSDGNYAASCDEYLNPTGSYLYEGAVGTGIYTIDPDGAGGDAAFNVYCDMKTDGGGWILVLNYLHKAAEQNTTNIMTGTNFPIQKSTTLGIDESADAESWGHASNLTMQKLNSLKETRIFCQSGAHTKKMHFVTSSSKVIDYFTTGVSQMGTSTSSLPYMRVEYNVRFLKGHSTALPTAAGYNYTNQGDNAMTSYPMYHTSFYYSMYGASNANSWHCDDTPNINSDNHHQIWVR